MRRYAAIPKKYEHIDFTPPEGVANAAAKGLELRQKASPSNRGGLTSEEAGKQGIGSGVQRAVNLKNRDTISPKVIKQMRGFLSRSEKSSKISPENKGTPWNDKGYVAWLLWGGDPAKAWTDKIIKQMEAADEKEKQSKTAFRFTDVEEIGGIKTLPQGNWEIVRWSEMSDYMKGSVWDIYDLSYGAIGKHIPDMTVFGKKYKYLYMIDIDDDILPDAFIAYKPTHAGFKITLGGTDGTRIAKKAMIQKMKELIRQPGWYAEASHKVADIMESAGMRPIDDEEVVRKTLRGKNIEWLGGGKYSRQLGKSSISAAKSLYGTPRVAMQVRVARRYRMAEGENEPTNPKLWAKVQALTKGEVKSIKVNGKTINGPNDGKGFTVFPSAYANGWSSKVYKDLGGGWKKKAGYDMPRKFDREHCESKTCDEMGFSEKASCRPYKDCYRGASLTDAWGSMIREASGANGFMSDYRSMTFDNFLDPRSRVWSYATSDGERLPLIMTEIEPTPNHDAPIWLKSIVSPERQGTGQASAILRKITDLADKHGVAIWLTPKPFGNIENALSASKLKGWYKRYGWEPAGGDVWIRQPVGMPRTARGKAKKDVGHGGLDEWFSGHGGAKGKGEDATWGDWVSISPVTKTLPSGKKVEKGDIVGECGISDDPDWKEITKGGEDPLKCMPRQKAYDMPKAERAEKAKAKQRAEDADSSRGKKPTMTPTFQKEKGKKKASDIDRVFRSPKPFTGFRPVFGQEVGFKPQGLWYSCGSEWDDWCRYEMPQWITGSPHVYRIEVNLSRMIVIRSDADFRDFDARYRVFQRGMSLIDWSAVARDYDGIEICPYQSKFRMSSDWYYPWDVASGCIWGSGAFKSVEPVETCGVEKSATVQRIQMKREASARLRSAWRGNRG